MKSTLAVAGAVMVAVLAASRPRAVGGAVRRVAAGLGVAAGVTLVIAGGGIGSLGTLIVSHAMARLLVGVSPTDPWAFGVAVAVLTLVAVAGCYLPARRAMRVDPIVALR